jgi:hypothetical protein
MAARRDAKTPPSTEPATPAPPPYYIAEQPLFIGGQFGRAHNPGDRVPPDSVDTYGWHHLVRPPDGYTAPEQTQSEPETPDGQATTKGKGDV